MRLTQLTPNSYTLSFNNNDVYRWANKPDAWKSKRKISLVRSLIQPMKRGPKSRKPKREK